MKKIKTILRSLAFRWLKRRALAYRIKSLEEAQATAKRIREQTGQKVLIFYTGGEFKALTKEQIRNAKAAGLFKGLNYADIEKRAVYVK